MPLSKIQTTNNQVVPNLGRRNLVINGAMQVGQRGTQTSKSTTAYTAVDRFQMVINSSGTHTTTHESLGTRVNNIFANSLKVQCTGNNGGSEDAGDYQMITQPIEGRDLQQLAYGTSDRKTITVSFYVRSNLTGTFQFALDAHDSGSYRHYSKTYTISSANTWEKKTITVVPNSSLSAITNDNTTGLELIWFLTAGSDYTGGSYTDNVWQSTSNQRVSSSAQTQFARSTSNNFQLTGVQLEVSDTATNFEHESFDESLIKCQRYYQLIGRDFSDTTPTTHFGWGYTTSSSVAQGMLQFERRMRVKPTFTQSTDQNLDFRTNVGPGAVHSSNAFYTVTTSETSAEFTQQNHAGNFGGAGQPYYLKWNGVQGQTLAASVQLDAEL